MANTITLEQIQGYRAHLHREERAPGTIEKYLRDVRSFAVWLGEREISKEAVASWKEHLMSSGYDAGTVNVKLAAVNAFLRFADWEDCRVKSLKRQRRVFREHSRELTREEYERLLRAAGAMGRERLELLMETICATGIRVGEVKYITVEAAWRRSPSRERSARFCCPTGCAESCCGTPKSKKSPPARSFSPEAVWGCPESISGLK